MLSLERPPTSALAPFVQLLWCLELDAPGAFGGDERIVPDGIVELVLHYREPMRVRHAGGGFRPQPRASLVSQTRRFVEIRPGGATGLVSVRFRPWGAHRFLRQPLSELSDRVVDARDLWGRSDVAELEERLAAAPDTECRLALVEAFLLRRLGEAAAAHLEGLVRAFWASGGRTPIAHLARDLGWSERGLQRVFAAAVGASPKGYARLCRFLGACTRLRRGDWASLTELGHACGYYDQSHFTSDFKALAGLTPGEFLSAERLSFLELA